MNMSPDATNLNTTTAYPGAYVPPAGATSTDTTSTTSTGTTGTGAGTTTGTGTTTAIDPSQSSLSASFGPYVMDMLSRGWGLANLPYTPFTGQRYADPTALQKGAFKGYEGLGPYQATQFNTGLGALGSVQDYMNPYMQSVVDAQAREARRQSNIAGQSEQAKFAQAGAFGGARDAIMRSERERNLQTQIGDIQAKGLQSAYDLALKQRLGESTLGLEAQRLGETANQFGANYGLRSLADQMAAGREERGIAQQPLDFGYQQFQESQKYPYQQATYMQSLLQGLPLTAPQYSPGLSAIATMLQGAGLGKTFGDWLGLSGG
jgi:hypothetical protein